MYRTTDPRFRRRLNDITHTLESANVTAQSNLYIFTQNYIKPCVGSIGSCFTTCIDASCPSLNWSQRDRLRRHRGRGQTRGRAELSFDFYDDWDDDEGDGLLGWSTEDFDRGVGVGVGAAGSAAGYGTLGAVGTTQPGRQRGMSYPKARRKSTVDGEETSAIRGSSGFWRRMFGGRRNLPYKPSMADLQEHPESRRTARQPRQLTEGEALLEENELVSGRSHRRTRSGTQGSHDTTSSYSSRGDLFPSDEEVDAIPLDDEFAMVLERRTTLSNPDTESSSARTERPKRGKRPSAESRKSTRRTFSSRSSRSDTGSSRKRRSRTSSVAQTPSVADAPGGTEEIQPVMWDSTTSLTDMKREGVREEGEDGEDAEDHADTT